MTQTEINETRPSTLPPPVAANLSRKAIESFAEQLANEYKLTEFTDDGDPLVSFINRLGGRVHYQDPPDFAVSESGSIEVKGKNNFDIFLSTFTGPMHDRFTMGHELGHYFVHSRQGKTKIRAARHGHGLAEREADLFSAALLMPANLFREAATSLNRDVYALAGHFRVSRSAAARRLTELDRR